MSENATRQHWRYPEPPEDSDGYAELPDCEMKLRIYKVDEDLGKDFPLVWWLDAWNPATGEYTEDVRYFETFDEAVAAMPEFVVENGIYPPEDD